MSVGIFSSIAPYLPLQDHEGSLRWLNSAEYALKAVARGPDTSMVNSGTALYDFIEDIRNEIGDLQPLSPQVAIGISRLCDEKLEVKEGPLDCGLSKAKFVGKPSVGKNMRLAEDKKAAIPKAKQMQQHNQEAS